MNVQDEIKELKQRIIELEQQAEQEKEFPKNYDDYWYIDTTGDVYTENWHGFSFEIAMLEIGNVYKTKEQAEFVGEKLKVEAELRKFSRPFKKGENNCFIEIHLSDKALAIDGSEHFQTQGTIYFESTTITNEAIDTVGAERIKKHIFGVED